MTLGDHVRTLGRGPGRSRSLTQAEASDAMTHMLSGDAAAEAIGALLMLLRMKGETAEEIAGFASVAQATCSGLNRADLDWPSYAAGRTRGAPWFLLAARLVADAGHRILVHGWNGPVGAVRDGLAAAGVPAACSIAEANATLDRNRIVYLPLELSHPGLFKLLHLREVLGLRSCINTVCRMLNPARAEASVQGVFHPSYRLLQADAAQLLGWRNLSVIKGGGGEFERNPSKDIVGFGLRNGALWTGTLPALMDESRRMVAPQEPTLAAVWSSAPGTDFQRQIILGTVAAALDTLGHPDAPDLARTLWENRALDQAA